MRRATHGPRCILTAPQDLRSEKTPLQGRAHGSCYGASMPWNLGQHKAYACHCCRVTGPLGCAPVKSRVAIPSAGAKGMATSLPVSSSLGHRGLTTLSFSGWTHLGDRIRERLVPLLPIPLPSEGVSYCAHTGFSC